MKKIFSLLLMTAVFFSCEEEEIPNKPEEPQQPNIPEVWDYSHVTTATLGHQGLTYMWDESVIPEITISVSLEQWNKLLGLYDKNPNTKDYVYCDITYKKGSETHKVEDAGIRLRGNTSRRRPEVGSTTHQTNNADWQHCHFGVNLRKFVKDADHEIKGIRKFNLKWFKDDACYAREVFCYDLFRRAGIWTAAFDVY